MIVSCVNLSLSMAGSKMEDRRSRSPARPGARRRPLRVWTDCSGMEAIVFALLFVGAPFLHLAACDNDPQVKQFWRQNFSKSTSKDAEWFDDICARDHARAVARLGPIDLYVAGFPCQPYSLSGKLGGLLDEQGRGIIVLHCIETIKHGRPKVSWPITCACVNIAFPISGCVWSGRKAKLLSPRLIPSI